MEIGKFSASLYSQWHFWNCNWYDFTWINLETEWDKLLGSVELDVGLLGLNLHLSYQYTETEALKELRNMVDEIDRD